MEFMIRTGEDRTTINKTKRFSVVMKTIENVFKPLNKLPLLHKIMERSSSQTERNGSRTIISYYQTSHECSLRANVLVTFKGKLIENNEAYIDIKKNSPIIRVSHKGDVIFEGQGILLPTSHENFVKEILKDETSTKKIILKKRSVI